MTLTPGMEGDHLGPQIHKHPQNVKQIVRTKLFTLLGHFPKMFKDIFIYIENDSESDKRVTINNLKCKNTKHQIKFQQISQTPNSLFYYILNFHNSYIEYLIKCCIFCIFVYLVYIYIYIYIHINVHV